MPDNSSRGDSLVTGQKTRDLALQVLLDYHNRDAYLNILLFSSLEKSTMEKRDRAFVTELVQGTVRMKGNLDWALAKFSNREIDLIDNAALWLLRLSAYQIMYMDVPDYATCDLAARLAKKFIGQGAVSYVNGVLRALSRGKQEFSLPDVGVDPVGYLEVRYSHPRWIIEMWIEELGFQKTESICRTNNEPRLVSLRCNLLKGSKDNLVSTMRRKGFYVEDSSLVPEGILVRGGGSISQLEEFNCGNFTFQDQGSMLAGHAVFPEPGMNVLDLCAAPGGKAGHIAELMQNVGRILAVDKNQARIFLVENESNRLGHNIIETMVQDAIKISESLKEKYDRVLIDAPCSGLGTLSRKPDIRWRRQPEDIERLCFLQKTMIREGAKMVNTGKLLIYSTCTISKRENIGIVESFLEGNKEFVPVDLNPIISDNSDTSFIQLYPDTHGCDGMFISAFQKVA